MFYIQIASTVTKSQTNVFLAPYIIHATQKKSSSEAKKGLNAVLARNT